MRVEVAYVGLTTITHRFPYKIGYDCAGVVVEIGKEVNRIKVGDEVFVRVPEKSRGTYHSVTSYHSRGATTRNHRTHNSISGPFDAKINLLTLDTRRLLE